MNKIVQLHSKDDVVISLHVIRKGESLQIQSGDNEIINIKARDDIPKGHKILVNPVKQGADVLKFGYSIGKAKKILMLGSGFILIT